MARNDQQPGAFRQGLDLIKNSLGNNFDALLNFFSNGGSEALNGLGMGAGQSVANGVIMDNVLGQGVATQIPGAMSGTTGGLIGNAAGAAGNSVGGGLSAAANPGMFAGMGPALGIGIPAAIGAKMILSKLQHGVPAKYQEALRLQRMKDAGLLPDDFKGFQSTVNPDYAPDYVGNDAEGNRVNNKFQNSRNEADLQGEDLMGRAAMYDLFGKDADREKMKRFGDEAIKRGLVRERRGFVTIGGNFGYRPRGNYSEEAQAKFDRPFNDTKALADEIGINLRPEYVGRQTGEIPSMQALIGTDGGEALGIKGLFRKASAWKTKNRSKGIEAAITPSAPVSGGRDGERVKLPAFMNGNGMNLKELADTVAGRGVDRGMQIDPGFASGLDRLDRRPINPQMQQLLNNGLNRVEGLRVDPGMQIKHENNNISIEDLRKSGTMDKKRNAWLEGILSGGTPPKRSGFSRVSGGGN